MIYKLYIPSHYINHYNDTMALIDDDKFFESFSCEEMKLLKKNTKSNKKPFLKRKNLPTKGL